MGSHDLRCRDKLVIVVIDLYKQVDDVPMGACASPSRDEVFMGYNESIWLENCTLLFKPHCKKFIVTFTKYLGNFWTKILGKFCKLVYIFLQNMTHN